MLQMLRAEPASRRGECNDAIFGLVGTPLGKEIRRWCRGSRGHRLRSLRGPERNRVIIDVGSLDGKDAIQFARSTRLPVWTFEAAPTKIEPIRARLSTAGMADNVTVFAYAMGNRSGDAWFEMRRAPHSMGRRFMRGQLGSAQDKLVASPAAASHGNAKRQPNVGVVAVPMKRLDDLVGQSRMRVPFMKVDAQGFDFEVLRGSERLLREGRIERLLFEYMPSGMPHAADALRGLAFLQQTVGHYTCAPCGEPNAPIRISRPTCAAEFVQRFANASARPRPAGGDWYDDIACVHRRLLLTTQRTIR